jgi:C-terminal processing protease CtpA/Prc
VAEITDELSSLGGGVLSHFTITFDQENNEAFFQRDSADLLTIPPLRGTGMSFRKTPAYWKVLGVLPGSPADASGVTQGDLVTRINGEPVANWNLSRFDRLVAGADRIDFTFINGTQEAVKPVKVLDIVP